MDLDKQAIGRRIKHIRSSAGLSTTDFGKIAENADRSLVTKWERGDNLPNDKRLKLIADIGSITVEELLYGSFDEFSFREFSEYWEKHHVPAHIRKIGLNQAFKNFVNSVVEHDYLYDEEALFSFINNYFIHETLEYGVFDDYDEISFNTKAARFKIINNPEGGLKKAYDFNIALELNEGNKWIIGVIGCFSKVLAIPPVKSEEGKFKVFSHFDYGISLQDEINHITNESNLFDKLSIDQSTFSNACQDFSRSKIQELVATLLHYQIKILNHNGQLLNGNNTLSYEIVINCFNKYYMIYSVSEESEITFVRFLDDGEEHFISGI